MPMPTPLTITIAVLSLLAIAEACALAALARSLRLTRAEASRRADLLEARLAAIESKPSQSERPNRVRVRTRFDSAPRPHPLAPRPDRGAPADRTLIAVPDLASSSSPDSASADLSQRFGAIWDLAEAGASPDAIARDTGQPVGQVELILGLRRPKAARS